MNGRAIRGAAYQDSADELDRPTNRFAAPAMSTVRRVGESPAMPPLHGFRLIPGSCPWLGAQTSPAVIAFDVCPPGKPIPPVMSDLPRGGRHGQESLGCP